MHTPNIPMGKGPHGGFPYASHCQIFWLVNAFLKVLGILKPFFQEGFKRGSGAEPLVPHKLQFTNQDSGETIPSR